MPHTAPGRSAEWSHVGPLMLVFICLYIYIYQLVFAVGLQYTTLTFNAYQRVSRMTLHFIVKCTYLSTCDRKMINFVSFFFLHRRDVAFLDQFPALWNKALLSI